MASDFVRVIGIDWSGAGTDRSPTPGLAVAEARPGDEPSIVCWQRKARCREELVHWLALQLRPEAPRALVGLDFAFGFPVGSMREVFSVGHWLELPGRIADLLDEHGRAAEVARSINSAPRFAGNGPFRTNETRSDHRFYLDRGVPYFRLVETYVPQAISPWYLGSGATVGFSTITGLAALGRLLRLRARGECQFSVFPFEAARHDAHVLAEIYPAIWPKGSVGAEEHERDALRTAKGLASIPSNMMPRVPPMLSVRDPTAAHRIAEEGWIAGVH
jgi:hypothetical protein